jgi:hypothetical protein
MRYLRLGTSEFYRLVLAGAFPWMLRPDWQTWTLIAVIGVVAGLLVARYGDPMFEKIVTTLFFWR